MGKITSLKLLGLSLVVMAGCTVQPEYKQTQQLNTKEESPPNNQPPKAEVQYRNFSTDTLYSLLVAELSASRQQFDVTVDNYVEQAHHTQDRAVIARAARITQYFRRHTETLEMGRLWLQQEPNNYEAIVLIANAYLGLQQPLKALDYTEQLLTLHQSDKVGPKQENQDLGAFFETVANYGKRSDEQTRNTLIVRFHINAKEYPELAGIKVGLSVLYQHNQSIDQAFKWVNTALKQDPERNSAITQEILLLRENNQTSEAITKLKALLEKDPSNDRLRLMYARLLSGIDTKQAYEQFTRLSLASPQQLDIKFSRALLAIEINKLTTAKSLFEELIDADYQPNNTRFYLGHVEEQQGNLNTALSLYLSVNDGDNYLPAHNRAGRIFIKQGKLTEAQQLFTDLRKQHSEQKENIYIVETNLLVRHQIDDIALKVLNEAIHIFPDSTELRYSRSTIYERQDKLALMESDFRHILTVDPDNVHALNGLGYFLTIRTERYEEAYTLISKALTLRPEDAAIIDSMGWVNFKLGRYDEAVALLTKAFSLYPDPEVAAHLGEVLWSQGEQQKAKQVLQESLNKNPEAPEILELLKRLNISL